MSGMPSINLLPYFDAAARNRSFKLAAKELFVTPSAVSQRIADLEEQLGLKLFLRKTRSVELTEAGKFYADVAATVIRKHHEGYEHFSRLFGTGVLRVNTTPIVAHELLIPRIGLFHSLFPHIDLRVETCFASVDLSVEPVDVCIRFGRGEWKGTHATKVGDVSFALCGSASIADKYGDLDEVLSGPLVSAHPQKWDWKLFCSELGVEFSSDSPFIVCGSHVESALLATQGHGVMIALLPTMKNWLDDGRLVPVLQETWMSQMSYYVVCKEGRDSEPDIQAFTQWILEVFDSL